METKPEIRVTLSDELIAELRKVAQRDHIPLRWLVAGLVCDTMSAPGAPHDRTNAAVH